MAVTVQGALAAREEPGRAPTDAIATPSHRLVHVSAAWPALQGTDCDSQPLRPCESAQSPLRVAVARGVVGNESTGVILSVGAAAPQTGSSSLVLVPTSFVCAPSLSFS